MNIRTQTLVTVTTTADSDDQAHTDALNLIGQVYPNATLDFHTEHINGAEYTFQWWMT